MKLVPIIMDSCLFQFDALKFFLGVRLHEGLYLTNFFHFKPPKFLNEIVNITSRIAWIKSFTTFLALVRDLLDVR